MSRSRRARAFVVRVAWAVAAVVLALGTAGIGAGLDHLPGSAGRPELTWGADQAIAPGLDAATADLQALSGKVNDLADLGRSALAALLSSDTTGLQAAITAGIQRIADIEAAAAALRTRLDALPGVGPGMDGRLGPAAIARYATLVDALPAVDGLGDAWERLGGAAVPAVELTGHLTAHDRIAGDAVRLGADGKYAQALTTLVGAKAELAAARKIRDQLASHVDTSTLDEWIARNAEFDAAVADLWTAIPASKGKVTAAVRAATKRYEAARVALPPDTKALVVILGDLARGGLNQAVIAIEQARGQLLASTAAAAASASPEPSAAASPAGGSSASPETSASTETSPSPAGAPTATPIASASP